LNSGKGIICEQLEIVLLCKTMQWGYETYVQQPQWFLDIFRIVGNLDAEYQKKLDRINKRKR